MQIVIDKENLITMFAIAIYAISGGSYDNAKDTVTELLEEIGYTPLPKVHGDLIDRSKLKVHYVGTNIGTDCPVYLLPTVDEAPAIIEADKEDEE